MPTHAHHRLLDPRANDPVRYNAREGVPSDRPTNLLEESEGSTCFLDIWGEGWEEVVGREQVCVCVCVGADTLHSVAAGGGELARWEGEQWPGGRVSNGPVGG